MARYRKLDLRTWNDEKFRELSPLPPSGQALWLFLILGPQTTNIPGLFEASEVGLADRLGWSLEAFREAFREVSSKGMAKADWKARLVWLPKAPEYNKPESPNVVKSWASTFDELPECPLKWEAYQSLKAFTKGLSEGYFKAFTKAFPKPSGKAMPNQEQEQEQEQENTYMASDENSSQNHSADKGRDLTPPSLPAVLQAQLEDDKAQFQRLVERMPQTTHFVDLITWEHNCYVLRDAHGQTWADLHSIAERYASYVRAGGVSGPQYVIAGHKFFSPTLDFWRRPWTPPPNKAETRLARNLAAAEQARRELEAEERAARAAAGGAS